VHEVRIKIKISSDIKLPGVQRVFWFALMRRILGIVQVPLLSSMLGCPSQALGLRRYIRTKVLQIKNSIGCCRGYAALPKTLSYRGGNLCCGLFCVACLDFQTIVRSSNMPCRTAPQYSLHELGDLLFPLGRMLIR